MASVNKYASVIEYLIAFGGGRFGKQCTALEQAEFTPKPFWFPFKSYNSVLGNTVYLSKGFEGLDLKGKAAVFCHEGTHLLQWKAIGGAPAFVTRYAQKAGRWTLEKEAYGQEINYWIMQKEIHKPQTEDFRFEFKDNRILKSISYALQTGYFFGDAVNEAMVWEFFEETVRGYFA